MVSQGLSGGEKTPHPHLSLLDRGREEERSCSSVYMVSPCKVILSRGFYRGVSKTKGSGQLDGRGPGVLVHDPGRGLGISRDEEEGSSVDRPESVSHSTCERSTGEVEGSPVRVNNPYTHFVKFRPSPFFDPLQFLASP